MKREEWISGVADATSSDEEANLETQLVHQRILRILYELKVGTSLQETAVRGAREVRVV